MPEPWRDWYHITVGTYGQWLPGDERSWRERNHHEHVHGNYKNPPAPTKFSIGRLKHSKNAMKFEPFAIAPADRQTIGELLLASFKTQNIPILALAVCEKNFHALVQCANHHPKEAYRQAKMHVTLRFAPIIDVQSRKRRPIWEGDGAAKPIREREHALNAYHYILDHIHEGGWIWSCGERSNRKSLTAAGSPLAYERPSAHAVGDGGL